MTVMPASPPLNAALHTQLQAIFGDVQLANEGQAQRTRMYRDLRDPKRQVVEVDNSGEYYRIACPFCNDQRHRLWINYMYGQPSPHDGQAMFHLAICYNEDCLSNAENRDQLRSWIFRLGPPQRIRVEAEVDTRLPQGYEPPGIIVPLAQLPANHQAWQYLLSRKYTPELVQQYEIHFCVQATPKFSMAEHRLIFPIYDLEGQLVGWQARSIGEPTDGAPKYFTMPGFKRTRVMYNIAVAQHYPFAVLVEGVIDVHFTGRFAMGLLSKSLATAQLRLLQYLWMDKPILVLLDGEATEDREEMVTTIRAAVQGPVLGLVLPHGRDPADFPGAMPQFIYAEASRAGIQLPVVIP